MDVIELISHKHLRWLIGEAQLDICGAATESDRLNEIHNHLGPDSELAQVRRALGNLEDSSEDSDG